jgi:hypothetical protein
MVFMGERALVTAVVRAVTIIILVMAGEKVMPEVLIVVVIMIMMPFLVCVPRMCLFVAPILLITPMLILGCTIIATVARFRTAIIIRACL